MLTWPSSPASASGSTASSRLTTHRVSKPCEGCMLGETRITIPMAVYVREDEMLEVLPGLTPVKYEPVSAIRFHTGITNKYYGDDYAVGK